MSREPAAAGMSLLFLCPITSGGIRRRGYVRIEPEAGGAEQRIYLNAIRNNRQCFGREGEVIVRAKRDKNRHERKESAGEGRLPPTSEQSTKAVSRTTNDVMAELKLLVRDVIKPQDAISGNGRRWVAMRRVVTDDTTSAGLRSGQASGVCSMDEHDTKTEDAPQAKNVSS